MSAANGLFESSALSITNQNERSTFCSHWNSKLFEIRNYYCHYHTL